MIFTVAWDARSTHKKIVMGFGLIRKVQPAKLHFHAAVFASRLSGTPAKRGTKWIKKSEKRNLQKTMFS